MLTVNEVFFSIQGEGTRAGQPCVFVRLTGCPLRCVWCDTAYAFHEGTRRAEEDLIAEIERHPCRLVELTGGEPLSQPGAFPFITRLLDAGWQVLVETSGHVLLEGLDRRAVAIMDVKAPGSGETHRMEWRNLELLKPTDEVPRGLRVVAGPGARAQALRPLPGPVLARARRPGARRAGRLDPGGRPPREAAGPAPQIPVAGCREGSVTPLAVVCVSGGMDSCLTAAIAAGEHRLAFLHANYGQRTEAKELECFRLLAEHFRAERTLVVDFTHLRAIGGSSLTDPAVPVREGPPVPGVIPSSYVPFRNAHLLSAAACPS